MNTDGDIRQSTHKSEGLNGAYSLQPRA